MNEDKPKEAGIPPSSLMTDSKAEASQGSATGKLQAARSQLMAYAKDLKQMLEQEGKKTQLLKNAHAQMLAYARDLKLSLEAEQQKNRELEQAYADTILRLARASRYKDEETGAHIERLSHYSQSLALAIGWDPPRARSLFAVAPMHDVGKIGVPDAVLGKHGPLTEEEWQSIKQHPLLGASLLDGSTSPLLEMAKEVALTHHERWDGSGYPRGLKGTQIPITGRIVMLCDLYDALRSRRPYKPAFTHQKTCDIILNGNDRTKPTHFDPHLLEAFREMHQDFNGIYSTVAEI
ncbi:MAG: HD domain-containing protein [Nitrospirales bacterium]|nr:HD domain-containing protein [Nitrospirales bacterium]MDR4482595.1 HD domain-containing protein [Nitrospirales bacterium]